MVCGCTSPLTPIYDLMNFLVRKMAETATPHFVSRALKLVGVPSSVTEKGELNIGEPKPV